MQSAPATARCGSRHGKQLLHHSHARNALQTAFRRDALIIWSFAACDANVSRQKGGIGSFVLPVGGVVSGCFWRSYTSARKTKDTWRHSAPVLPTCTAMSRCSSRQRALPASQESAESGPRIRHHVGMPLSEMALLKVAGDRGYARGEDYVRYVRGLRVTAGEAYASVQAKRVYTVELDWSGPQPDGSCTCPHAADGHFCKHLVAVGLAVIDSGAIDDASRAASALEATVQAMDVDELRELVMTLAHRDGEVRRMLEVRATAASGDDYDRESRVRSLCAKRPGIPRIRRLSRVLRGRRGGQ